MLYCPKCETTEDIKWMIRHQKANDEDDSTLGNVITLLCTECGFNQSVFIQDYLEDIFTNWTELTGPSIVPFEAKEENNVLSD